MASKDVNIKIKADSTDAQKGIKKAQSELNKFSKEGINKTTKDIQSLGKSIKGLGLSAIISAEVKVLKQYLNTIKETAKAYNNQLDAENGLAKAAKNNPYINGDGVKRLKEYAKELERTAAIEDNESLEIMRQLVASGRTEAEVMQIMAAAADYAAGANIDLATAAKQLNATYSGQAGLLSRQIGDVKALTAEQLKHGDAVKLVGDKYKGMAEELANTDTKLENAKKSFKEALGELTQPAYEGWNVFWTNLYNDGIKVINKLNQGLSQIGANKSYKDAIDEFSKLNRGHQKSGRNIDGDFGLYAQTNYAIADYVDTLTPEQLKGFKDYLDSKKKLTDVERNLSAEIDSQYKIVQRKLKQEEEEKKAALEKELSQKKQNENAKTYNDIVTENANALEKKLSSMEREANLTGSVVDKQSVLNEMIRSYIDLLENGIDENDPFAEEKRQEIEEYVKWMRELEKATGDTGDSFDKFKEGVDELADIFGKFESLTSDITSLFRDSLSDETSRDLADLSEQYANGIIDYETYCNEKTKLSKKAAQEEYKLKMWEWSASLLTATANIAQGVSAALTKTPPASYIMAALTGAAGAIQIASIVANKPKPPQFANGGIVPGTSYSGDNVIARVNSGEMVLNSAQQGNLWNMLNNGGGMGINMPITINNNASDKVKADATMSRNGLIITVNDIVNSQMQKGVYTGSMNIANAKAEGVKYL